MKMTANISKTNTFSNEVAKDLLERVTGIISTKWKLKSILETGIITDEAKFNDVDIVFSHYYIYAMYGNRVDKFKYKFISPKFFTVDIEGVSAKCRVTDSSHDSFIFHVDFNNSNFIVELESA